MRIKVHLRGSGVLPFDYHYYLTAAMYKFKEIANFNLATMLHYSKEIKTLSFSEIMIPKLKITKNGIKILEDYAYLIYTFPSKYIPVFV